jgi:hypothetical protein
MNPSVMQSRLASAIAAPASIFRLGMFTLASLSIGSLLLYFFGVASFAALSTTLAIVEIVGLVALGTYARRSGQHERVRLLIGGLWAGCLATLVYDVVRVPIAHSGVPVFKAISYFGTVLLGVEQPTVLSEVLGWTYHFSNGVSFGLMYAAIVTRPGPITALLWGLSLEGAMLLTPYAEVFGYQRDARFLAITIGSHACYGLTLWAALRQWNRREPSPMALGGGIAGVGLGLVLIAADFHRLEAATLPTSPPTALGPNLHVTWDVPEPDRVGALWVMKRFHNPRSSFHFVRPFESLKYGTPFDVPEAEIRRAGALAATELLLQRIDRGDEKLQLLARAAHLSEIAPWMLPSDPAASQLASDLRGVTERACGSRLRASCLDELFAFLDGWYAASTR